VILELVERDLDRQARQHEAKAAKTARTEVRA
jgi:hypothetical protein